MSRQEDFIEAGIAYRMEHGDPMAIGGGALAEMVREMNRAKPFEDGAEHGYQYAIDKACEWMEKNMFEKCEFDEYGNITQTYACSDSCDFVSQFVEQFRKAMQ